MIKPDDPRDLCVNLLTRSQCMVQVASVITDAGGRIMGWGWNGVSTGFGLCAERHAISRSNRKRLWYGTIYVAGKYKNKGLVKAKPCEECQRWIDKYKLEVCYRDRSGKWVSY